MGEACCRRGGVAGAEPPHKGGPNRPDRPELQWLGLVDRCQNTAMQRKNLFLQTNKLDVFTFDLTGALTHLSW